MTDIESAVLTLQSALKQDAEMTIKLQRAVQILTDHVTDIKRRTDIDIRILNDAIVDLSDRVDFEHGRIDRVMGEVEPIKATLDHIT